MVWNTETASIAGKKGYKNSNIVEFNKKAEQTRINAYLKNPKFCLQCDCELPYEKRTGKFCNRSCAATYNGSKFPKIKKKDRTKKCLNCNTITSNNKFCSNSCCIEYYKKENERKNQELIDSGKQKNPRILKQFLISKYGEKCSICGWAEINSFTGKIPIEMHHKDGNSDNNFENNLILVCPNHHSLTETYRNNYRKSKRKNRKLSKKQMLKSHSWSSAPDL